MRTLILLTALLLPTASYAEVPSGLGGTINDAPASLVDVETRGAEVWVAYADKTFDQQVRVKKLGAEGWEEVGPVPAPAHARDFIDLLFDADNNAHVLFGDGLGLTLIKWNGTEWSREGKQEFGAAESIYDATYAFQGGVPHVVYENKKIDRIDAYALIKMETVHVWTGIDAMDSVPTDTEQAAAVSDIADDLYVAWFERGKSQVTVSKTVKDGEAFEGVGKPVKGPHIANFLGMQADGSKLYVAIEDSKQGYAPSILKLDDKGKKWQPIAAVPAGVGTKGFAWSDQLALVWVDGEDHAMTIRFDGSAWTTAAQASPDGILGLAVASNLDRTYVAVIEADGAVVVRQF
jgi:hypothetical protein